MEQSMVDLTALCDYSDALRLWNKLRTAHNKTGHASPPDGGSAAEMRLEFAEATRPAATAPSAGSCPAETLSDIPFG